VSVRLGMERETAHESVTEDDTSDTSWRVMMGKWRSELRV
jgi:hypothetical protein